MKLPTSRIFNSVACGVALALSAGASAQQVSNLDISSNDLESALLELAQESDSQILFSADGMKDVSVDHINGRMTITEALSRLLNDSGFQFQQSDDRTYIIKPAASADSADSTPVEAGSSTKTVNEDTSRIERVEVIGSNIRVNQDTGALPVSIMSAEDIEGLGITSGADLLAEIPQQGAVNFNSERVVGGVNDARGDVSSINLRGIGTGYTLTLLNGRRLVLHPGTQAENLVPVTTVNSNTLPVKGIKRVEVLRDGAAAVYGSDAVAGVINYVLNDQNEGGEVQVHYGNSDGTDRDTINIAGAGGWFFNENKTHVSVSAGYYERDMMMTSERDYAASSDLRYFDDVPEEFVGDTLLDNRTTSTPWGEFSSDAMGRFHIQPSADDCDVALNDTICAAEGSLPRALRYDSNSARSLSSEISRYNVYSLITHQITDEIEGYTEALYYGANAKRVREQSGNLTAQRFTVSENAYYNPFNEDITVRRYRPIDTGTRDISVDDYAYRVLGGLRGYVGDWDFDTALLYSKAKTEDNANRINTTAFQEAVNSTDPATAYNIFSGASTQYPTTVDNTIAEQSVIDSFMMDVTRESETELALFDFKVSRPDIFSLPAGEVGFAAGMEYRFEAFADTRSDMLNGTTNFVDVITGEEETLASQVLGSSPTPDSSGNRNVVSAYAELAVPLVVNKPFVERLDMQLAGRYEDFSDVGDIFKPKVALSWKVNRKLQFRGAYAEGFKAPGLPQTTAVDVARSNTRSDPVFDARQGTLELRNGSADLKPETSENLSVGVVLTPTDNLTLTVDWWNIRQSNVVGILSSQTQILYDALLRSQGSQNDNVVRDDNNEILYVRNDYRNLLPREISGIDYSAFYKMDTEIGDFTLKVNVANLRKFEQGTDAMTDIVSAAQNNNNPALLYNDKPITVWGSSGSLLRMDGRPKWRGNVLLTWRKEQWGAGLKYKYISDVEDTGLYYTNATGDSVNYTVDNWSTLDAYVSYELGEAAGMLNNTRVTLGMRNVTDEEPPFANSTFGFNSSLHSAAGRYKYITVNHKF